MSMVRNLVAFVTAASAAVLAAGNAMADVGAPRPWQTLFQDALSPVAEQQHAFHDLLLWIIAGICVLVLALLIFVILRFNRRVNPTPSKTSHNTLIEVIWTVVPIMILIVIMIPSLKLLYFGDRIEEPDMTLKAIGYQWYWGYEYVDEDGLSFEAVMVPDDKLEEGQLRLLTTDNAVVLPVQTNIRLLITAEDVIHSWAVPAAGVKLDAVPGRLNETWMRLEKEGMYYGQCSELCGALHGFMPIMIKAVSKEEYADWLVKAKEQFASNSAPALKFAEVAATRAQ